LKIPTKLVYDTFKKNAIMPGIINKKQMLLCNRSILRPSQRAFFCLAMHKGAAVFVLARPKNCNKISLLKPIKHENHLWLQEICKSDDWSEILAALFEAVLLSKKY